jgi:hypothetical protein
MLSSDEMTDKKETKEQLLQKYGELQFSESEVCEIMEQDKLSDDDKRHYRKGQLLARAAVVKAVYTQAKQGSTPCQKEMLSLIAQCEEKNRENQKPEPAKRPEKYPEAPPIKRRPR